MKRYCGLLLIFLCFAAPLSAGEKKLPKPIITGLTNPESVCVGSDGRVYITEIGVFKKDGDGRVLVIDNGKAVPFATGLDDPKGIVAWTNFLFVADNKRVLKIDNKGKVTVFADEKAFPTPPLFLNDITVDVKGVIYVSDSGVLMGEGGAVFRIDQKGKVNLVTDGKSNKQIKTPNGLVMDGMNHLLMLDFGSGELLRIRVKDGETTKIAEGFDGGDGLAWDNFGRLFITSWKTGKVWGIPRPGQKPILIAEGFESAADLCVDPSGKFLLIPDMKVGRSTRFRRRSPAGKWTIRRCRSRRPSRSPISNGPVSRARPMPARRLSSGP